jgi:hypothetical protein
MTYKLAIRRFHANQRDAQINTNLWECDIWLAKCEKLLQVVKCCKQCNKKNTFTEKVDHESAPYGAIEIIEHALFTGGYSVDCKQVLAGLHNQFTFLLTTFGILWGESVYLAELSDLLCTIVQRERDPHRVTVMILQMATG